jgi:hypothetical protein
MNYSTFSVNQLWQRLAGLLGKTVKPGDTDLDVLKRIVGVSAAPTDSFRDLLRKWVGGAAKPTDDAYYLIKRKLDAAAAGVFKPGDTVSDMLKKLIVANGG